MDIPRSGIGGLLGLNEKKCFDVKIPAQILSNALAGGGKQDYYMLESDLKSSRTIEINAEEFVVPATIEQLQNNYLIFDDTGLEVGFK